MCVILYISLGAFTKLQEVTVSFIMSVVCFLLGNSPASEFYIPMFWNTVCSVFIGR